ncbi:beta-ketoacyl synthase family protein, partial [Trypanosoma grayi]|uniref:beta-ketoacyl synthase family protein n=1 Tax=Trypanosoma grayi TaxID=71804 RepID=UPI0004F486C5
MPFGAFPPHVRRRVAVTGLGAVTPHGLSVASTWSALCEGRSATRALAEVPFFTPAYIDAQPGATAAAKQQRRELLMAAMPCKVAAPICAAPGEPTFAATSRETRATLFAHHAVEEALLQARLLDTKAERLVTPCAAERVGVNIGVGMPSLADVGDVSCYLYADAARVQYSRVN